MTDEQKREYNETLDVTGTGIMGYVTIPRIKVKLPVYHGTSDGVLQIAAGHLAGTSLPVGGATTHAVVSGHTGLPSARLLTGLDELKKATRSHSTCSTKRTRTKWTRSQWCCQAKSANSTSSRAPITRL